MKKLLSIFLTILMVGALTLPVLAEGTQPPDGAQPPESTEPPEGTQPPEGDTDIPREDVIVSGPEKAYEGQVIAVDIRNAEDDFAITSRFSDAGLTFLGGVGGTFAEEGVEERFLLTQENPGATYFYRVTGKAGEEAIVDVHDVHVLENGTDRMGTSKAWRVIIEAAPEGQEPTEGPLTFADVRAIFPDVVDGTALLEVFNNRPEGLTWDEYLDDFEDRLVLGFQEGNLLSEETMETQIVCTGGNLAVFGPGAQPEEFYTVVVRGDVLGTGKLTIAQVVRVAQAMNGTEPLEGAFLKAAEINEQEGVDIGDLVTISRWLSAE